VNCPGISEDYDVKKAHGLVGMRATLGAGRQAREGGRSSFSALHVIGRRLSHAPPCPETLFYCGPGGASTVSTALLPTVRASNLCPVPGPYPRLAKLPDDYVEQDTFFFLCLNVLSGTIQIPYCRRRSSPAFRVVTSHLLGDRQPLVLSHRAVITAGCQGYLFPPPASGSRKTKKIRYVARTFDPRQPRASHRRVGPLRG